MYVLRYTFSAKSDIEWNPFFSKTWSATYISVGHGHPDHVKQLFLTDSLWLIPGTMEEWL